MPLESRVTFGAMVTLAGPVAVVTVVVFWTVVVVPVDTLGVVALSLPESSLEMIAAASPPSASTSTTPKAIIQPLVPDFGGGVGLAGGALAGGGSGGGVRGSS